MIRQPIELESSSNPRRIQQVFNCRLKNIFHFGFWVFWRCRHIGGMFLHFWRIFLALGTNLVSHIFGLSFFCGN